MAADLYALPAISLSVVGSLIYSRLIASNLPKGLPRLFSLLPILSLFILLPLSLSSVILSGIVFFYITFLASLKLIFLSFDSGPLFSDPPLPLPLFLTIACFPIRIKPNQPDPDPLNSPKLPLNLPAKVFLLAAVVAADDFAQSLPPAPKLCFYSVALYFFIDIIFCSFNAIVRWALGIKLEPPFNEPYLATSLRDFWGRRWNLLVSSSLRWSVFSPVRAAVSGVLGRRKAASLAVFSVFVVSGLMHEMLFFYVTGASPSWEVTGFFVLHGVCDLVEFWVVAAVGDKWRLHYVVSGPLTLAFVIVTGGWLFFPPLFRTGTVATIVGECKAAGHLVKLLI